MDLCPVVSSLRAIYGDLSSLQTTPGSSDRAFVPRETLDALICGLERVYRELVAYEMLVGTTLEEAEAIESVRMAVNILRNEAENLDIIAAPSVLGRPRIPIGCDTLESLIESNFTTPQIAYMLGVSLSTVRRRMDLYGLSVQAMYAALSDEELDKVVCEISQCFPMCGSKQMTGHLLARGLRVQQARIREALR